MSATTLQQARSILAAGERDPSISKGDTIAALTKLLAEPGPAIELHGTLVEVGAIEGVPEIGVTMAMHGGGFAALTGLTEDQARAVMPLFQREIFIALGGAV